MYRDVGIICGICLAAHGLRALKLKDNPKGVLGRLGLGVSGVLKMVVKPGPPRRNVVLTGSHYLDLTAN